MKKLKRLLAAAAFLLASLVPANAQNPMAVQSTTFAAVTTGAAVFEQSTGIGWHQIVWRTSGTVATCSVQVESSADNSSWNSADVIASQTCTSNGSATGAAAVYGNYVRVNVTAISGGGSVVVTYMGFMGNPSAFAGAITGSGTTNVITKWTSSTALGTSSVTDDGVKISSSEFLSVTGNKVALTADWTCGTGGTVSSCTAATIVGSGGGVPLTFTFPLTALSWQWECNLVVGQATAATANQWNILTATNGATNVTASYSMNTAATAITGGAATDQAATTTTFQIAPSWTLGGTATKMPVRIWGSVEGASASGTVLSLQLLAPTVADLVTIYRGSSCRVY